MPAGTLTWQIRKRVRQHEDFADESEYLYPHVLFVAGNDSTERRIARLTSELYVDFEVFTTTQERLLGSDAPIWQNSGEALDGLAGEPERNVLP